MRRSQTSILRQGHEFHPYYEWKLYSLTGAASESQGNGGSSGTSHHQPPAQSYQDQMPAVIYSLLTLIHMCNSLFTIPCAQAPVGPLSSQDKAQLGMLLDGLDGTKEPIKVSLDQLSVPPRTSDDVIPHLYAGRKGLDLSALGASWLHCG